MNKENLVLSFALVVVVLGLIWSVSELFLPTSYPRLPNSSSEGAGFQSITTGTTGTGDVAISLTPQIKQGQLIFSFAANTHSVSLEQFDLKSITTLEIDGKTLRPSNVPAMTGHHVSGQLVFDAGSFSAHEFTVRITGIPKVQERVFLWKG